MLFDSGDQEFPGFEVPAQPGDVVCEVLITGLRQRMVPCRLGKLQVLHVSHRDRGCKVCTWCFRFDGNLSDCVPFFASAVFHGLSALISNPYWTSFPETYHGVSYTLKIGRNIGIVSGFHVVRKTACKLLDDTER